VKQGRIIVGGTEVGSFMVDGDGIQVNFYPDAVVRLRHRKGAEKLVDCTLEKAIQIVSDANLVLGLDYPSEYAAEIKIVDVYLDHKA
jgi:hypothetical protein